MTASASRSLIRLLAPLALLLLVAFLASCGGGGVATTTSVTTGSTGTSVPGSATATTAGSVTSTTATPDSGPTVTPPATPPSTPGNGPTVTPPSTPGPTNLPELEKAAQDKPQDLDVLGQLAVGYYQAKDYAKAEEVYKKMLGIKDSALTHNNLGNVYRDWNKADQAIEQYQAAIKLDPTLAFPYSNLAALYMMSGDITRAQEIAQSGIDKTSGAAQQQLQTLLDSLKK